MYGEGKTRGTTAMLGISATTNQACCAIEVNQKVMLPEYCWYFLIGKYKFFRESGYGGQQPNLNQTIIKNMQIPVPPTEIQEKIVEKINTIFEKKEKLIDESKKIEQQIENLPKSVLSKAFSGELIA